jgi:hypothetical protein
MTNEEICARLEGLKMEHHQSGDRYESCPLHSTNPSFRPDLPDSECNCGVAELNRGLQSLIDDLRRYKNFI